MWSDSLLLPGYMLLLPLIEAQTNNRMSKKQCNTPA
jgi:hypothetical protein